MKGIVRRLIERLNLPLEKLELGIDLIGDIAILKFSNIDESLKKSIATALLYELKSVRTIFEQQGAIDGDYRTRRVRYLAGEERTVTIHKENGCIFKVDIARCYFSPRLSTERMRIARQVKDGEKVLNMFAGVGPFSILIGKLKDAEVTSCEINPYAYELHLENNKLNKVEGKIRVLNLDASNLDLPRGYFDRIIMPHPSKAINFLNVAKTLVRDCGIIHYYRHIDAKDEEEAIRRLGEEIEDKFEGCKYTIRKVREVGPRLMELVADIVRMGDSGYSGIDAP